MTVMRVRAGLGLAGALFGLAFGQIALAAQDGDAGQAGDACPEDRSLSLVILC